MDENEFTKYQQLVWFWGLVSTMTSWFLLHVLNGVGKRMETILCRVVCVGDVKGCGVCVAREWPSHQEEVVRLDFLEGSCLSCLIIRGNKSALPFSPVTRYAFLSHFCFPTFLIAAFPNDHQFGFSSPCSRTTFCCSREICRTDERRRWERCWSDRSSVTAPLLLLSEALSSFYPPLTFFSFIHPFYF